MAKELHLDEPKVQALEENQFDVLGAPVFAKGHLRKYAELVGVPVDDGRQPHVRPIRRPIGLTLGKSLSVGHNAYRQAANLPV